MRALTCKRPRRLARKQHANWGSLLQAEAASNISQCARLESASGGNIDQRWLGGKWGARSNKRVQRSAKATFSLYLLPPAPADARR
jgi:hypothetical protein